MSRHTYSEIEVRLNHEGIENRDTRLVGWASVVVDNALKLNDIVILQRTDGSLALKFPSKRSRHGKTYSVFHPITKSFHGELEDAVLGRLKQLQELGGAP